MHIIDNKLNWIEYIHRIIHIHIIIYQIKPFFLDKSTLRNVCFFIYVYIPDLLCRGLRNSPEIRTSLTTHLDPIIKTQMKSLRINTFLQLLTLGCLKTSVCSSDSI